MAKEITYDVVCDVVALRAELKQLVAVDDVVSYEVTDVTTVWTSDDITRARRELIDEAVARASGMKARSRKRGRKAAE